MCVERRLVELNRMLLEERQRSRQDRLNLAKLQQELARQKSEHPLVSFSQRFLISWMAQQNCRVGITVRVLPGPVIKLCFCSLNVYGCFVYGCFSVLLVLLYGVLINRMVTVTGLSAVFGQGETANMHISF